MESNNLYDLQDEPLRLNRFVCEITLDGVEIDCRVVRSFREDRRSGTLFVDIASYENTDYEWLIDKVYNEKIGGKLTIKWLSPSLEVVKVAKYKLLSVSEIFYPQYEYGVNNVVLTKVGFKYNDKHIEYFRKLDTCVSEVNEKRCECNWDVRPTNYKSYDEKHELSNNEKAFFKASVELLEDAKNRVKKKYSQYDNTEDTMKCVLKQINNAENEIKVHAEEFGCSDADIENAKYKEPNGLEVEKYNRYLKKKNKKVETTFDFGDFNTALEWYMHHMIPNYKQYLKIGKFDDVDRDIEQNERPTIVVCSRQCGMTTHMIAWSLALISTAIDCEIWYVTHSKAMIYEMIKNIPEHIMKLKFLKLSNGWEMLENTETKSKIRFVSIKKSLNTFFSNKTLPDYVIYDNMAFYPTSKMNEFINLMDVKRANNHKTKEICCSTPSKGGSIFNFIALTAQNPIYIPWYEVGKNIGDYGNEWAEKMKEILGEDNFNVEFNCQIGCNDTTPKFKKERFPDDYGYVFFDTDFPVSKKEEDTEYEIEI